MKYRVIILMLILAVFKLESAWATSNIVDAALLKNKSEPVLYEVMGHLEYQSSKGFVPDSAMLDSLEQLIQTYALDGKQGYAYVINRGNGKVTWSTLLTTLQVQQEIKTYPIGEDLYMQSTEQSYVLAKNFWVKTAKNTRENFQIVVAINY